MIMKALHAQPKPSMSCFACFRYHLTYCITAQVSTRLAVPQEASCGCAGIFSAPVALQLYAQMFEDAGHLEHLEAFASHSGADFYGLPRNEGTVQLVKRPMEVPRQYAYDGSCVSADLCRQGIELGYREPMKGSGQHASPWMALSP